VSDLVETHSGHRLHEWPRRFQREGTWYQVSQVLARWQEPEALHFRVLADNGQIYHLEYNLSQEIWKVRPERQRRDLLPNL